MKTRAILSLAALLLAAACTRSIGSITPPAPTEPPAAAPTEEPQALFTLTPPPSETALPTAEALPATATKPPPQDAYPPPATSTPVQQATEPQPGATSAPSSTPANTPTITPTPFNSRASLGAPSYVDPMSASSFGNWSRDAVLPDTANIRLALSGGNLLVTGKNQFFDTWWFSWPSLRNFHLEMTVSTEQCSGKDTYGVIFRGPPRDFGDTYGYVAVFSCDGEYQLRRVVSADPYTTFNLTPWTKSDNIKSGANKTNVLGVMAEGDTIMVFANGFLLAQIKDDNYRQGRYGVFVSAGPTAGFTYLVDEIAYWELD
jgi:hypothetical protein